MLHNKFVLFYQIHEGRSNHFYDFLNKELPYLLKHKNTIIRTMRLDLS